MAALSRFKMLLYKHGLPGSEATVRFRNHTLTAGFVTLVAPVLWVLSMRSGGLLAACVITPQRC
jgi:hypothetical protein